MSRLEGGVYADIVFPLLHLFQPPLAQAKSPSFLIIGSAVRNPVRHFRQCEEVGPEFSKQHLSVNWNAVVQHVKITLPEVDYSLTRRILNICVLDVPLFRDGPVK